MKPLLSIFLLALCGCYTPSSIQKLTETLQAGNPSFILSVPTVAGRVEIRHVNPTIGFSATANDLGVSQSSPTNIPVTVAYHSMVPAPTMPVQSTNQMLKPQPAKK